MPPPALMLLEHAEGVDTAAKWPNYVEDIYAEFCNTAAQANLTFQGDPVICPFMQPVKTGGFVRPHEEKHFSFWHCMSEGPDEDNRTPDWPRCERIRWIGWVIRSSGNPAIVRFWENTRQGKRGPLTHVVLWFFAESYVVILNKNNGKYYLVTAYVLKPDRLKDIEKEWQASLV